MWYTPPTLSKHQDISESSSTSQTTTGGGGPCGYLPTYLVGYLPTYPTRPPSPTAANFFRQNAKNPKTQNSKIRGSEKPKNRSCGAKKCVFGVPVGSPIPQVKEFPENFLSAAFGGQKKFGRLRRPRVGAIKTVLFYLGEEGGLRRVGLSEKLQ